MSSLNFLGVRSVKPKSTEILDLSPNLLSKVFLRCTAVDLLRCSLVCRKFRETIEEEEDRETIQRCAERARIFICDRRRAILEHSEHIKPIRLRRAVKRHTYSRTPSRETISSRSSGTEPKHRTRSNADSNSTVDSGISSECSSFISDQYTDVSQSAWAFTFDFDQWSSDYEVTEVFFKNFCSFLDREYVGLDMGKLQMNSPVQGTSYISDTTIQQNQEPTSSSERKPTFGFNEEELQSLSAGRLETLTMKLSSIRPLHLIFRDYCCYTNRPAEIVFWFIHSMRENLNKLTLDRLQCTKTLPAHTVLSMANLQTLTVIQPDTRPNIAITKEFLISWLRLSFEQRRKIEMNFVNCKEITPDTILAFIKKWYRTTEPAIFERITLDGNEMMFHHHYSGLESFKIETNPSYRPRLLNGAGIEHIPDNESILTKVMSLRHSRRANVTIELAYVNRRIEISCVDGRYPTPPRTQVIQTGTRLSRVQSATILNNNNSTNKNNNFITRHGSQGIMRPATSQNNICVDDQTLVNKFIKFLATSSS